MTTTTTATVMTAREVAQQIKFRACLHHAVLNRARIRVKDQIRARGDKVHHYDARTISALAEELLRKPGEREKMIADCEGWVRELVFKAKRNRR
jgi:hypothetical protein